MNEFFELLKKSDWRAIFITPTKNGFLQFFRYVFVGGIATVVDWGVLFLLTELAQLHHLLSAVIAFCAGLGVNYILSKLLVFKASEARTTPVMESIGYAVIGVMGLGFTELIMFTLTDLMGLYYMASKMIATVIVLGWNYLSRRFLLYKN